MNKFCAFWVLLSIISACSPAKYSLKNSENKKPEFEPVVLAYIFRFNDEPIDPTYITHINYAFGHVNDCFNGVRINNEDNLRRVVKLKEQKPELKVLISIGGWGSGRFSEMAAKEYLRKAFAVDCKRVIDEFGLDGIDLDWEYPTQSAGGMISSSPYDTENFTLLCRDIRREIGNDKLLTFASSNTARYVDWKTAEPYLDLVNIMSYDLENKGSQERGEPVLHHSGLYRSQYTHKYTVEEGVNAHLEAGIPPHKIVLGIAFVSKGLLRGVRYDNLDENADNYSIQWDDVAKAAWLSDKEGNYLQTYEEPHAISSKCEFLHSKGLRGAMYWQYSSDIKGDLRKAVYEGVMNKK